MKYSQRLRILLLSITIIFVANGVLSQVSFAANNMSIEIVAVDPEKPATFSPESKVYLKIRYESEMPLRFQALPMRGGTVVQNGVIKNLALLHPPGKGEALAWVMCLKTTHIDSVRLVVFNEGWQRLFYLSRDVDVSWDEDTVTTERVLADWVKPLDRAEKRLTDIFYDPAPRQFASIKDAFFYINLASIPLYILLQLHMFFRYHYRWRELAIIPVFPYFIVGFYMIAGLDIERSLLITFLFRYTFIAFLWLAILWLAKRYWQDKLPPPKLYKPPKG